MHLWVLLTQAQWPWEPKIRADSSHCTASIPSSAGPLKPSPVSCLPLLEATYPSQPLPMKGWTPEAASLESAGCSKVEDSMTQSLTEEPSQAGGHSTARTDKLVPLCSFITWESFCFRLCQGPDLKIQLLHAQSIFLLWLMSNYTGWS